MAISLDIDNITAYKYAILSELYISNNVNVQNYVDGKEDSLTMKDFINLINRMQNERLISGFRIEKNQGELNIILNELRLTQQGKKQVLNVIKRKK
ncbi:hypothetical protein JCM14036_07120 [Desulfotomaculum defluvii]